MFCIVSFAAGFTDITLVKCCRHASLLAPAPDKHKKPANIGGLLIFDGRPSATRTRDALIKSQVLYLLS